MENITPGKWYTSSNKFTVLAGENMQAVAHIMNISEEERIANADLIAAAPETARLLAEARARISAAIEVMRGIRTRDFDAVRKALGCDESDAVAKYLENQAIV